MEIAERFGSGKDDEVKPGKKQQNTFLIVSNSWKKIRIRVIYAFESRFIYGLRVSC